MKIPEYDQRIGTPTVGPAPVIEAATAALPYQALSKIGEQTFELGKVIQDKQDEIFRVKELTNRTIQADTELGDLMMSLEQERDPQTAGQKFSDGYAEIKSRAMDGVADYKVTTALTSHLAAREVESSLKVKHEAFKWTLQNDQTEMMAQNDKWKVAAVKNPSQADFAAMMIKDRIAASVATGSILPETGRLLAEKETRDMYRQVMSQMIWDSPTTAPEDIRPLLIKSGMDPQDMVNMEIFAETQRTKAEARLSRGDKVLWEKNAVDLSFQIRARKAGEEDVFLAYKSGKIGPHQVSQLQNELDSTIVRATAENEKTSFIAMSTILSDVYLNDLKPELAARRLRSNTSILPQHKAHAMQTLSQIGANIDKIPPHMDRALNIYKTTVFPSAFSMNPRADEAEAFGKIQMMVWDDYFKNQKAYQSDPDLLIKKAVDYIRPPELIPAPNPYKTRQEILAAFDYYVLQNKKDYAPGPGAKRRNDVPKFVWQAWFNELNEPMPEWPR